jgi:hypothetical protein
MQGHAWYWVQPLAHPCCCAQEPLSRSISNGSDEYGRPRKSPGRVLPGPSGTLEGSITALADALSSLESAAPSAAAPSDKARRGLDFEPLQQVSCKPCACVIARLCHCHSCSVPVLTAALGSSYIAWVIRHFRQPANVQGEFLDAQGELVEVHQPESPGSISNGSGDRIALCSQVRLLSASCRVQSRTCLSCYALSPA